MNMQKLHAQFYRMWSSPVFAAKRFAHAEAARLRGAYGHPTAAPRGYAQTAGTGGIIQNAQAVLAARNLLRVLEASAQNETPEKREDIAKALDRAAGVAGSVPMAANELRAAAGRVRAIGRG